MSDGPKILVFDIETAPILGYFWDLQDENIGLNQIHTDWFVLSWAAKWIGDPPSKIMYMDQRNCSQLEDDRPLLEVIWTLLDEADIVVTQNGKKFDSKKLNARFVIHGIKPPSSYRHIDTYLIAKNKFGFTSNKLEYMTEKLCKKYKKLKHKKFSGFELWRECLAKNPEAWKEMEKYNKYDVLSLEELYGILAPWDNSINMNVYHDELETVCKCGNDKFIRFGYKYTSQGKYQRFQCTRCGHETRSKKNFLNPSKRLSLRNEN